MQQDQSSTDHKKKEVYQLIISKNLHLTQSFTILFILFDFNIIIIKLS